MHYEIDLNLTTHFFTEFDLLYICIIIFLTGSHWATRIGYGKYS